MYNAISKFILIGAMAVTAAACGSSDPDRDAASQFAQKASECLEARNYEQAMAYMDSVDQRYPAQVEIRREVMAMRPVAIEQLTLAQMAATDSIIADAQMQIQSLEPKMKHISGGTLEGYYVVADAYNPNFINTTGFEPRVNDADFNFYIVAQTLGSKPGISAVSLNGPNGNMQSDCIPADSPRRIAVEGSELVSFLPEEVASLGAWVSANPQVKSGTIKTAKGDKPVKLSEKQAAAFATAYNFAAAKQRLQSAINLRTKLEHQLQIARDQIANTVKEQDK